MLNKAIISLLACLSVALGGCGVTTTGQQVREGVATYGAQAMDEGLVNAEWFICSAASIGSVKRRYGKTKESADAYNTLCGLEGDAAIVAPPDS